LAYGCLIVHRKSAWMFGIIFAINIMKEI